MVGAIRKNGEHRLNKKITGWKSTALRQRGRPKMRWQDDIKHNLKVMKMHHWKKQDKSSNE
jgi:hypothetical protein